MDYWTEVNQLVAYEREMKKETNQMSVGCVVYAVKLCSL